MASVRQMQCRLLILVCLLLGLSLTAFIVGVINLLTLHSQLQEEVTQHHKEEPRSYNFLRKNPDIYLLKCDAGHRQRNCPRLYHPLNVQAAYIFSESQFHQLGYVWAMVARGYIELTDTQHDYLLQKHQSTSNLNPPCQFTLVVSTLTVMAGARLLASHAAALQ